MAQGSRIATMLRSVLGIKKCFGERIMLDFQTGDLFVLVGGDGDKLRGGKRKSEDLFLLVVLRPGAASSGSRYADDVDSRLVLVEAVEHDLAVAGRFVGQLHLGKADGLLGPVAAVVGRVGVAVHGIHGGRLSFAT